MTLALLAPIGGSRAPAELLAPEVVGRVRIELDKAEAVELRPGSLTSFPKDERANWEIFEPFREYVVLWPVIGKQASRQSLLASSWR